MRLPTRSKRTYAVVAVVGLLLASLVVGAGLVYSSRRSADSDEPLRGSKQQASPALRADPGDGELTIQTIDGVVASRDVVVDVVAPDGMTEMQIGFDPTFAKPTWRDLSRQVTLRSSSTGYQTVFARFRTSTTSSPSTTVVAGVTIDPTYQQAISGQDGSAKKVSWVRPLSPTTIMVRVEDGRIRSGTQVQYDFENPPDGDELYKQGRLIRVRRDGREYGEQASGSDSVLTTHASLIGAKVDPEQIDNSTWTVSGSGATSELSVAQRISSINGSGVDGDDQTIAPLVHDLVFEVGADLLANGELTFNSPESGIAAFTYDHQPSNSISPVVHVNQVGFTPDSPLKVGYLAGWFEGVANIDYSNEDTFFVRDVETDQEVFRGSTSKRVRPDEHGKGDLTGVDTYEMDFSELDTSGTYELCVDRVGCSVEFELDESVWQNITATIARSMYHQRSGAALGPPYSSVERPRPYHPDDGTQAFESSYSGLDALEEPLDDIFAGLVEGKTDTVVPTAWGGHFDAGDWDRRIQHLWYVRSVVQLVEDYPEMFNSLELNLPESGDPIPDLLDEALWSLDAYKRMQRDDGGIRGGIEASEHPQPNDTSWTDDLAVFAFEPDPWSSYIYAGVAAEMAFVLERYDSTRAKEYQDSALLAMEWAENQPPHPTKADKVRDQRTVAAAALLKLTGEPRWNQIFVEQTSFVSTVEQFMNCQGHDICDAAWIYLGADQSVTDSDVRQGIIDSFVRSADGVVEGVDSTAFGWALENSNVPLVWGLGPGGNPGAVGLLHAYELTGEVAYREAALRTASVTLGANPRNTVFITGVGSTPVRHPLIVDTRNGGLPVWPGTPVFGPHQLNSIADESWVSEFMIDPTGATPGVVDVPYLWQWQDINSVAMFNEYTVHQSQAAAIHTFGLLAGTSQRQPFSVESE